MKVITIPLDQIAPFRDRERNEDKFKMLCRSMDQYGLVEPIVVCPNPDGGKKYKLIAGHGRLRAAKRLKWNKVPAVVRETFNLEDFLVENWRKDLTSYEQAVLVELELRMGKKRKDVAEMFHVTVPVVDQYALIVRNLHPELQSLVRKRKLTMVDAHKIAKKLPEQRAQETLVESIKRAEAVDPSVRTVKIAVNDLMGAIQHRGRTDSVNSYQKLHALKEEVKGKMASTKETLSVIRSHWLKSVGEIRVLAKDPQYRKLFAKHNIEIKPIL